ncbi:type II toxin-antitoxin system RelE family toxin [Actinobaculum suis]|nr:hypothetical protein [Actinobaculum suis]
MGWKIEYLPGALKDLKKLDKQVARENFIILAVAVGHRSRIYE